VRAARRQENHTLESEFHARRFGDEEMRVVNRIERAAEEAELHGAAWRVRTSCVTDAMPARRPA
jgi:hypothetical protein